MRASGQGMDIKLAKSNIRKQVGSGLFSSLIPLAASIAPTIGKTLGLSALSGLASEGESQIVKAISGNGIPYLVTHDKLHHFANNSHLLNKRQIEAVAKVHKTDAGPHINALKTQRVGFLGTVLASVGIPMAIDLVEKDDWWRWTKNGKHSY